MGKWGKVRLGDVLSETITGEWGEECNDAHGVKVLRTTNFTNKGVIDYSNVVVRDIPATKIDKKKLLPYDIILEKSGGSDNQPVGRVVYFDKSDDIFLCNNFTQILRVNSEIVHSKYLFHFLFNLHRVGVTELLQNKTTGIRNLQVKSYMALDVPLPPLPIQQKIADVLDRASTLIEKRKAQIEKMDLLVKSQFIQMFGDPVVNPMGWESREIQEICTAIVDCPHSTPKYTKIDTGYMCIRTTIVKPNMILWNDIEFIEEGEFLERIKRKKPAKGDVVYTREGAILGIAAVINVDYDVALGQRSMLLSPTTGLCEPQYLSYTMNMDSFSGKARINTTGSASPHINVGDIKKFIIPVPPFGIQTQFSAFVEHVEAQKVRMKQGLELMELEYKSLMQKCFSGELF